MPMACAQSYCTEAARAAALASHSAASLAAAAGFREAARLLRSSEALARAATASLLALPRPEARGPGAAVDGDAIMAKKKRPKKKKDKKAGINSENMVVDGTVAGGVPAAATTLVALAAVATPMSPHAHVFAPGAAAASVRVLEKKNSRERSPRRISSPIPPSSSLSSPSSPMSPAPAAGVDGLSVGYTAVLDGLVSRPELAGCLVTLRSFDAPSARWAVTLDTTGESVRVKAVNLKSSMLNSVGAQC